jgi:hypothetical protein
LDEIGCLARISGAVLGLDRINPCALLLLVRKGDLISVGEKDIGSSESTWAHYQVGPDFELVQLDIVGRSLAAPEIRALLNPEVVAFHQAPGDDDALRDFLADTNRPPWLIPVTERQKRKWKKNRLAKYYHLVPSEVAEHEIPRCMELAPGVAVRFFHGWLDKEEVRKCIGRALESAILYAIGKMSEVQLDRACRQCPTLLLKNQASKLSEDRLMRCVALDPFEGFRIRNKVAPHLHARILAVTYDLPFGLFYNGCLSGLPAEISNSFHQFPVHWIQAHGNDNAALFRTLQLHGRMKIGHALVLHLLGSLPSEHLPKFQDFIGEGI